MIRSVLVTIILVVSLLAAFTSAQQFPTREITLVVPVAAGGGSDAVMRTLARELEPVLGVPVVVVNRPGAGAAVGTTEVAGAAPDGYTLLMIAEHLYNLPMTQDVPFTVDSFVPIATVNFDPAAIAVGAGSPWQTLEELVEFARENPGVVTMGNSGFGNIWHISATAFEEAAGIEFVHVPFTGAAPTVTATLGGHISAMVASPPELAAQVEAGELRLLATMGIERSSLFPDVPTLQELGYDLQFGTWRGIGAPAGTPDEVVQTLEDAIQQVVESEEFQSFMEAGGFGILFRSSAETAEYIENDPARFRELLAQVGILRE